MAAAHLQLFTAPQTLPFGVAVVLVAAIALLEGLGLLAAASPSALLDQVLPDIDADATGGLDRVLGWLHLGRVPALVLLLLFLTGYALSGYALQALAMHMTGGLLSAWAAGLLAVPPALTTVRALGRPIARLVPQDESSAVSEQSLVGRTGVVSAGIARRGLAAQARVRDALGRTHHLLVEPELEGEVFHEGAPILIVAKAGPFYRCIASTHPTSTQGRN
ncbi:membrane protein implicated in regulation of membrane protease activity [Pelomonas saccharophila]|uniref:Membrane protein implicated in regulation of membrane protease activity n=1 Tax=Roseateles saccharophilus TaxID=304 RepID=A0ABU1YPN2_ROSSA|nr:YqiJ family protein [Roseateles saccharophilus]MDR7270170.1 membrane protein implicated in regulation of membrane protease activity [Roseateles saccharophilus]